MLQRDRIKLLGKYRTPKCRVGGSLFCRLRDRRVNVAGLSDTPIMWPYVAQRGGHGRVSLILCGDLVRAVRRESSTAVAHWWGITLQTVWKWRVALGVKDTVGTSKLLSRWSPETIQSEKALQNLRPMLKSPDRAAKIAAAKMGKPRPPSVIEALRQANIGKKASTETRRKMRASAFRRGAYPPAAGKPFTAEEDALLGTAFDWEIGNKLGRDYKTIQARRKRLGIVAFRKRVV